jgi:hypothetical protein
MVAATRRLGRWQAATGDGAGSGARVLSEVRTALDTDLATPEAVAAIDAAADRGEDVTGAAALLGVFL